MRYKSFRIRNFKGIKDTTVDLRDSAGANVFSLVGLNESGKTTVLEAIHSFSPDAATSELLGGKEGTGVPYKDRVPRHLISTFTGDVSVTATLALSDADKDAIRKDLLSEHELELESVPNEIVLERHQRFSNGDFQQDYFTLRTTLSVRRKRQKKWHVATDEERIALRDVVQSFVPDIAYFPTLVFDFPKRIFLSPRGSLVDRFYRRVFQDILDYDGQGHNIVKDILGRVRAEPMVKPWTLFLGIWPQSDARPKIEHVMDRAGAAVTRLVFGRWNQIFGEDIGGKEVLISYELVEGEVTDAAGNKTSTQKHDIYVKFQIKDGTRRFHVNDRSLGFRWFFAFMLFTQFRVARSSSKPLVFLFDEPASNLHAAAQQKLIDSFPAIARGEHMLVYSTHSHYMIEPKWLEQTFIVTNRSDAPATSVSESISLDDESLDVQVTPYREFVNTHPGQTSYFQPILDRLDVVPSRFDMHQPSVVVEGKSDYYILRYAQKLAASKPELCLLPGLGAGTFGALAALSVGWNLDFIFLLDGDAQGIAEKERYQRDFGVPVQRLCALSDLSEELKVIEDLLDDEARECIRAELGLTKQPNKTQISRFFQERLASENVQPLSSKFKARSAALLQQVAARLKEA